jgi:hypothetical protein
MTPPMGFEDALFKEDPLATESFTELRMDQAEILDLAKVEAQIGLHLASFPVE